jgi:hypothetical protein
METFMLITWIMVGQRFEEVQLSDLSLRQCGVFRDEMLAERSPVRAECVPEPPRPRVIDTYPLCAHHTCGAPPLLPGRRRV